MLVSFVFLKIVFMLLEVHCTFYYTKIDQYFKTGTIKAKEKLFLILCDARGLRIFKPIYIDLIFIQMFQFLYL